MICVVGSGPAGVMCAAALVERGQDVTLLDGGLELEGERQREVAKLRELPAGEWPEESVGRIRDATAARAGGVPLKLVYGSDYPYRDVERLTPFTNRGTATRPTLARGGFSSVWGAAVLPYAPRDIEDHWPLNVADLAPHFEAVCSRLDLSAVHDDLAASFPLYSDRPQALEPSAMARAILDDLDRNRSELGRLGVTHGRARLCVREARTANGPGCVYCGLCLHGCPHGLIYNAASTLDELSASGRLRYVSDRVVRRVEERGPTVRVHAVSRRDGAPADITAERVYLAAGVLGTTRILLESLEAHDRPIEMLDSQYYLLPLLRRRAAGDPRSERLHTLAQIFLEVDDPAISARTVHLQLYTYNDLYARALRSALGPLGRVAERLGAGLLNRLVLIQGYLHSDESPSIRVTLRRSRTADPPLLELEAVPGPGTAATLRRVVTRLRDLKHVLRARPLRALLRVAPPGRGFHSGGTFPMSDSPGEFRSDLLGRPQGFRRVHAVDASILPSVPATTITLTVMANAHRIGSAHGAD